jgi:hypothetical protein
VNTSIILKEAWQILRQYRVLWIFGFLLAMTTVTWEIGLLETWNDPQENQGLSIRSEDFDFTIPGADVTIDLTPTDGFIILFDNNVKDVIKVKTEGGLSITIPNDIRRDLRELEELFAVGIPRDVTEIIIGTVVTILIVFFIVAFVATVIRYMAEAALIRSVNDYARTGKKRGFRQVLRLGWSRSAWRFFLIDLLVRLPLAVLFLGLFLISVAPLLLWLTGDIGAGVAGTLVSAGLFYLTVVAGVVLSGVITVLVKMIRRACALEDLGVISSIGRGFRLARHNLKDIILMAVILLAVSIGFAILMIPAVIVLFPVFLGTTVAGGLTAIAILFPVFALANLALSEVVAWIVAGILALAVFIPVVLSPFYFLGGLLKVYISSAWTLTYREIHASEKVAPAHKSDPNVSDLGVAPGV